MRCHHTVLLLVFGLFSAVSLADSRVDPGLFTAQLQRAQESLKHPDSTLHVLDGLDWRGQSDSLQAEYFRLKGSAHYYQGRLDSAIAHFTTASKLIDSLDCTKQFTRIHNGLAVALQVASLRKEAVACYTKALGCAEFRKDVALKRKIYNNLSILNREMGNVHRAQAFLDKAFEQVDADDHAALAALHNSRGQNYLAAGTLDSALAAFEKSLDLRPEDDLRGRAITLNNLGYTAALQGELAVAQEYYLEVAQIREQTGDLHGSASVAINMADIALEQGQLARAGDLLHNAQLLNESVKSPELASRWCASRSRLEEKRGNASLALDYFKRHKRLEDSLRAQEVVKEITAAQYDVTLAEAENKVKRIEREEALKEEVIQRQRLINLVLAIGVAFFIGLLALLLYQIRVMTNLRKVLMKERDEAQQKARFRRTTLNTVVHELRTPMNAIRSLADLIYQEKDEQELRTMTDLLRRSSDRLLGITNNVLTYARLEEGALEVVRRPEDISALAKDIVRLLQPQAKLKGIEFTYDIEAGLQAEVDRSMVEIVLINLIGNALKFTDIGGVDVSVKGSKHSVDIRISDTGLGIDPEEQQKVFEPFYQTRSQNASHSGSGLGLSIVASYLSEMGAAYQMKSAKGEGTTFLISFKRV